MSERAYDEDLKQVIPLLWTVQDLSSIEAIQTIRSDRVAFSEVPPDRDDVEKEDRLIPGRPGDPEVAIRIYRPKAKTDTTRPGLLEIHGGGFLFGDVEMMDPWCQAVAGVVDAIVVSVEYRLAPEHPFPAGVEDCYAALSWMAANADDLGIDRTRIAVGGQSAGGGLAAATALLARDRGGPALCFQLLEIPELDDRLETPSMQAFVDTPLWNRPNAVWSWRHYLGPDHTGDVSPYAAPARAESLAGLPPAYVSTMEFDPLRDEGLTYAMRMMQAGVSVELHNYAGTFHGSALVPHADSSRRNQAEIVAVLTKRLHPQTGAESTP
jgi:acetyl esterase/lipase